MTIRNPQQVGAVLWYDMTDASTITVDGSNLVQSIANKLGTHATQNFNANAGSGLRPYAKRAQDKFGPNGAGVLTQYRNVGTDNIGSGIVQQSRYVDSATVTIFLVLQGDYGTTYTTYNRGILGRGGSPGTSVTIESGSILRFSVNGTNNDTNISPLSRIHNVPLCVFIKIDPTVVGNLKISTDFATYLFDINSSNLSAGGCPLMGLPTTFTSGTMVGWYGCCAVFNKLLTSQEMLDLMEWAKSVWVTAASPYPTVHTVTDISQAADPECIYYGQSPAIVVGNQVSYKATTETNGWPVSIDAQGFPIIDAGGATGTDSFKFNIGRSGVWDPVPPASNTWAFTIESEVPPGPPILYTANSGSPIRGGQLSVPYTGSNLGSDISTRKLYLAQGAVEVEQTQVTGSDLAGTFNVIGFSAGGKLQYGQAQLKATRPSVVTPPATLPTFAQRTHTVSATATGAGTGTDVAPWTLKQAMEQCQPGMIIGVKAGVYVGTKGMGYAAEDQDYRAVAWHPRNSGTAVSRIVFVAEYLAALTTDTAKYSDLRSGATVVGYGWPAFGCMGYGTRPAANYVDFIGFYSSEDATNNKLWGGGDNLTNGSAAGDATITGAWGRGNNSRFLYCRLVRNDDIENAGRPFDNKSHFRFEDVDGVEVADCHLFIRSCTQGVNNTCFTLYGCQNIDAHHNYCYTDAGQGYCWHPKLGFEQKNSPFSGLKFHHNRVENFFFMTRQSGQRDEGTEASCTHIYSNLFINGRAPFTWTTTDGKWTFDGARYYNNTFVNMTKGAEASGFELEGKHQNVPALNPRNVQYFNNIVYNASNYMMTNYDPKTPPGLDYISDFVEANRNCIFGITGNLFRGDATLEAATWAQWQATSWNGRVSDDNSIVANPLFAETTNYTLSASSPCLTLGRDLYGTYGPANATIPAGCYVLPGDIIGIRP